MKPPTISSPDSCWEASDYKRTGSEDEIVFDPWDPEATTESGENIGLNKEKSAASDLGALDTSEIVHSEMGTRNYTPSKTSSPEPVEPPGALTDKNAIRIEKSLIDYGTAPIDDSDKEDLNTSERAKEDMIRADIEPIEFTDNRDLPNDETDVLSQGWLDEELPNETEEDGLEHTDLGDPAYEDSDTSFDDIPEFDEDAQQPPWEIEPEEEGPLIRRARDKAADIASLLYLTSCDDQEIVLTYLTDLFGHPDYSHSSTFRAIKRIASDGLDFETLKAMVELRSIWRQRTDWWKRRFGRRRIRRLSNGETAFTWVAAHRVCLVRKDFPPEMMIGDDWLNEWLRLSHGSLGYLSFPYYIDVKIQNLDAELLEYGLSLWQQCEKDIDVFERHTAACSVAEVGIQWR